MTADRLPPTSRKQLSIQRAGADLSWQDYANCRGVDPDLFFPERGASTREAKEVCAGCVVRDECLEYALVFGEKFGVFGGKSERERRRIRKARRAAALAARQGAA
ncbi:MAG TPA: WhiB family transcriptional regulator [Propionibacteriaceae bacterium]|nr:WhiB family transcriptional regulator [Propionibacteriaceae bacterium]